jgi:hypothetical protein
MSILKQIERKSWGAPSKNEIEHDNIARAHFLKYCDSGTCIRGRSFVVSGQNKGWYDGVCLECAWNPYNMVREGEMKGEQ